MKQNFMKRVAGMVCIACLWGGGKGLSQQVYFENISEGVYVTRFNPSGEKALTASMYINLPKVAGTNVKVNEILVEASNLPDNSSVTFNGGWVIKDGFNIIPNETTLQLVYPETVSQATFVSSTVRFMRPLMDWKNNVSTWREKGFYDMDGDGVKESGYPRSNNLIWYKWNDTFDYFTEMQSVSLGTDADMLDPYLCRLNNDPGCLGVGFRYSSGIGRRLYAINEEGGRRLPFPEGSPFPNEVDLNNDGLHDLIATDDRNHFVSYLQHPSGEFIAVRLDTMSLAEPDSTVYQQWESVGQNSGYFTWTYDQLSAAYTLSQMFGDFLSADYKPGNAFLACLDINKDNLPDLIDTKNNVIYYNRGDNRYSVEPFKGRVTAKDLNGDLITDYLFYEEKTKTVSAMVYESGGGFTEQILIQNMSISNMYCYDFDKDGDVDVLLTFNYSKSSGWAFLVFCENDGKGKFTIHENSFEEPYLFWDCADIDNDGYMDLVVSEMAATSGNHEYAIDNVTFLLGKENFGIRKSDLKIRHQKFYYTDYRPDENAGYSLLDYNNDGRMDLLLYNHYMGVLGIQLCDLMEMASNTRPEPMDAPQAAFNRQTRQLKISWAQGRDKESSATDLTYALRIGSQPGMGDVYFACGNEDGTRLRFGEGNMGSDLDKVLNVSGWRDGTYYIAVQAIDPGGQASVWSPETAYEHQCMSASFIVGNTEITGGDTLTVALPGFVDAAYQYTWDFADGKVVNQNADGSIKKLIFPTQGTKTIRLTVSDAAGHEESSFVSVSILGGSYLPCGTTTDARDFVDLDGDGQLELITGSGVFQKENDFSYKKVGKIYNSDLSFIGYSTTSRGVFRDLNMDGKVDYLASSHTGITCCNKGDQVYNIGDLNLTFSDMPESDLFVPESQFAGVYYSPDLNNDGFGDAYYRSNNIGDGVYAFYFSEGGYQKHNEYDMNDEFGRYYYFDAFTDYNRDGYLDFVSLYYEQDDPYGRNYVPTLFQNTGNNSFKEIPLFEPDDFQADVNIHMKGVSDFDNDGIQDLYYARNSKVISVYYGEPGYQYPHETCYTLPQSYKIGKGGILFVRDMDNNGYPDIVMDTEPEGLGILYFSSSGTEFRYYPDLGKFSNAGYVEDFPFMDLNGDSSPELYRSNYNLYSHLTNVKNTAPQAPLNLRVYQTETGIMLKWDDAVDAETPAVQMRYNVSVKKKGATGENAFIISPLNDLKDEAAVVPTYTYLSATQMQVPISRFEAGREYELQVQSIDLWNAHSPMSEVYTFVVENQVAVTAPTEACPGVAVEVSYVGTESGICVWEWDGGEVVSENDGKTFHVSWDTPGVKDISVTVAGIASKKAIKVNERIDLDFDLPETTLAGCEVAFTLPGIFRENNRPVIIRKSDERIRIINRVGTLDAVAVFPVAGDYWIEVSVADELCGEVSNRKNIKVVGEVPVPVIRLVGIDAESGYNKIMWDMPDMPEYVTTVDIYKEGGSYNRFEKIAQVDPGVGYYIDRSSSPRVTANRYNIRLNTIYDVESAQSKTHSSTHLMLNKGMGGSVNLVWNQYEGAVVENYRILRGTTADDLSLLAEISGANTSYTDLVTGVGTYYYALEYDNTYSDEWKPLDGWMKAAGRSVSGYGRSNVVSTDEAFDVTLAKSLSVMALENTIELTPAQCSLHLYAEISPVNVDYKNVNWAIVEGDDLAVINRNGLLTVREGTANGTIVVRASTIDGSNLSEELHIHKSGFEILPVSIVLVSQEADCKLTPAQPVIHLNAIVSPENANDKSVTWSLVQGQELATLSECGILTAIGDNNGEIVVRATSVSDPEIYAELTVLKSDFATGIENLYKDEINIFVRDGLHIENLPSEADLILYSIDGKCLKEQKIEGEETVVWALDTYPTGVYLLQVKGKTMEWRGRFVNK